MTDAAACGLINHAHIRDALPIRPASEQYAPPKRSLAGRKVAGASKGHFTGQMVIPDGAQGRIVMSESRLEILWTISLLSLPEVDTVVEQVPFEWYDEQGKARTKFFDIVAVLRNGKRLACEVKPEIRLQSGRVMKDLRQIAAQLDGRFDAVRLLTDRDLDQISVHNAETFFAMRAPDPEADAAATAVVARLAGSAVLADVSREVGLGARGTRALIRLIADRKLRLCRHERISLASCVRRVEMI
ncbi:hypothetical protein [Paracoccus sp. 22332]|uniref:hypothetical protein n=1 Tax=Paracoccus sp. 22332 TaxID=3453913 RepID=UPI003F826AC1